MYFSYDRRWAEIVGELKQENMYLERKIEHLNTQLQAKVDYEDTYKSRLQCARDELKEVKYTLKKFIFLWLLSILAIKLVQISIIMIVYWPHGKVLKAFIQAVFNCMDQLRSHVFLLH